MEQFIKEKEDNFAACLFIQMLVMCLVPVIVGALEIAGLAEPGAQAKAMLISIFLMLIINPTAVIIDIIILTFKN